jgi:hypothetical protein
LEERGRWLLAKAARHAVRTDPIAVRSLRQLFDSAIGAADPTALVADMLLFANRGLDRYLDNRGALLPDDELAAARSWQSRPMRLVSFDLDGPTGAADAVDLRSGERLPLAGEDELSALLAGELPSAGQAVLARPLPVGERWLLSPAGVPVPDTSVARALELVAGDVGPLQLLQLLVDLQVDAMSR